MPQIAQLPDIFWSQLFWLAIVFGILFFVIGRGMLPKIQATVDARDLDRPHPPPQVRRLPPGPTRFDCFRFHVLTRRYESKGSHSG